VHENQTKLFFALKAERHWGNPRRQFFGCRNLGKPKETWKPEQIRFFGVEPREKHGKNKEMRFLGFETQEKRQKNLQSQLQIRFSGFETQEKPKKTGF